MDECNAAIGLAVSHLNSAKSVTNPELLFDLQTLHGRLQTIQQYMFDLGAHLATPQSSSSLAKVARTRFSDDAAKQLETWIDDMDPKLPTLTTFILPGGHPAAAALHLARTIARRAERVLTPLIRDEESDIDMCAYRFLNRLSDFLFVASRVANRIMGCQDVLWCHLSNNSASNKQHREK